MKVELLRAGQIGQTIARLLHRSGDNRLTVFDRIPQALDLLASEGIATCVIDTEDAQALRVAIEGHHTIVNALPCHLAIPVAQTALALGCHSFDWTEDVAATQAIKQIAAAANTAFMPQCGLGPGFIGIVAHHLAKSFDTLHDVKRRVGALRAFPTDALKFKGTWSVDGLINEYCHPCESIRDGQTISALPLEGLEPFSLDGPEYEAFKTSGGLGTLCETLDGRVRNLDYKTEHHPGHRDLMMMLLGDLQLKHDQETLNAILRRSMPGTMQDVVLVFVRVSGLRGGRLVQEVFHARSSPTAMRPYRSRPSRSPLRPASAPPLTCSARESCPSAVSSARSKWSCRPSLRIASARPINNPAKSNRLAESRPGRISAHLVGLWGQWPPRQPGGFPIPLFHSAATATSVWPSWVPAEILFPAPLS